MSLGYEYKCFYKCCECGERSSTEGFHFDENFTCPFCNGNVKFVEVKCLNAPVVIHRGSAEARREVQNLQDRISAQREMGRRLGLYNGK